MRAPPLSLLCAVALCALAALPATAQPPNPVAIEAEETVVFGTAIAFRNAATETDAERLLRAPLTFEEDSDSLTAMSAFRLEQQALTLIANPSATIHISVSGEGGLAAARARALAVAFWAHGVDPWQLSFERHPGYMLMAAEGESRRIYPSATSTESVTGADVSGVELVRFDVKAWPSAQIFLIPNRLIASGAVSVCDPPQEADIGITDNEGWLRGAMFSRMSLRVIGRELSGTDGEGRRLSYTTHRVGVPPLDAPVDLAIQANAPCDDPR